MYTKETKNCRLLWIRGGRLKKTCIEKWNGRIPPQTHKQYSTIINLERTKRKS